MTDDEIMAIRWYMASCQLAINNTERVEDYRHALENLDGHGIKDGMTQQTIQEWRSWIEEQMKKDKE